MPACLPPPRQNAHDDICVLVMSVFAILSVTGSHLVRVGIGIGIEVGQVDTVAPPSLYTVLDPSRHCHPPKLRVTSPSMVTACWKGAAKPL